MTKDSKIVIDGTPIEIFFGIKAMIDIKKETGQSLDHLKEWILGNSTDDDSEDDVVDMLIRLSHVIGHLANSAIFKHNSQVRSGFKSGEILEFYDIDMFTAILDPFQMQYYFQVIFECINTGSVVSVPENLKLQEEDEVLREIDEEKNLSAGVAEKTCDSSGEG